MNWEAIGAIGEIVGAGAVVVTLAYLATQIRQSTKSSQATSREAVSRYTIDILMQLSRDNETVEFWSRALEDPAALTANERLRRDMMAYAVIEGWELAFAQWQRGVLTDQDWKKWDGIISNYMGRPGFRETWMLSAPNLGSEFREHVESLEIDSSYDFHHGDS